MSAGREWRREVTAHLAMAGSRAGCDCARPDDGFERGSDPRSRSSRRYRFEERDQVTIARDAIEYDHRGGSLVNRLLVARDMRAIFRHRAAVLVETFGEAEGARCIGVGDERMAHP